MKQLYIVGRDISHSKSPVMYNALYKSMGLDWHYGVKDIPTESEAADFLQDGAWLSVNITTPYKPLAFRAAQVRAASAKLSGGVNMLINRDGVPVGLNTDGVGCIRHIERAGYSLSGARVAVCGTGPTSLAIFHAAATAGAASIVLVGRDKHRSEDVLNRFIETYRELAYATIDIDALDEGHRSFKEAYEEPDYLFGSYTTSTSALKHADIIIDATPLGMHEDDPLPFSEDLLGSQTLVYDVVYGHGPSKLLATASQAGCNVLDGRGMLVAQAAENATALLQLEGVDVMPSWDDMFAIMAKAAGFPC